MPTLFDVCFAGLDGYVELSVGGVKTSQRRWVTTTEALSADFNGQVNVYFGPAVRRDQGKMGKNNCWKSQVCWVDVDNPRKPVSILPPTVEVFSGHGWHLYWAIETCDEPSKIEQANMAMAKWVHGDSAHNIDRLMRVPGTINSKDNQEPIQCETRGMGGKRYSVESLLAVAKIPDQMIAKILTGDQRGYRSASERDWAIIRSLVEAGFDNQSIGVIFANHPCGVKARREGSKYLIKTIQEARARKSKQIEEFKEVNNSYYTISRGSSKQVSTFTIEPTMLLEGSEDYILSTVRAQGDDRTWSNVPFPRSAFSGIHQLSKHLPHASWAWLGSDADVRRLLAYLNQKILSGDIPKAKSTHVIGYHVIGDTPYFVINGGLITADGRFVPSGSQSPIVYVDPGRECPHLSVYGELESEVDDIASLLPQINTPEKIWPIIGWHMAAPMKVQLMEAGYKFPLLNVCGTRGSGKTATIQQVFQAMLGYTAPTSYDVGTTKFVALSLWGSTNAVPISFSELRASANLDLHRYARLAYDIGKDARGRADQTTVEYPLLAPFVVDGEDMMDDPAIQERSIIVVLDPRTIKEFDDSWEAFKELQGLDLGAFALPYLSYTLRVDVDILLDGAEQDIQDHFPRTLPDRIRKNLTVCWLGILAFSRFMEEQGSPCEPDGPEVLEECLDNVFSSSLERAPVAADDYVEYIVNQAAQGRRLFAYDIDSGVLWFQHSSAYEAYTVQRRRQGKETLSKSAVLGQLGELLGEYLTGPEVRKLGNQRSLAYGVILSKAKDSLDIPESINLNSITITF